MLTFHRPGIPVPLTVARGGTGLIVGVADTAPYFSTIDQMALMTITPYSRTLFDDADAAAWRTTLGLGTLAMANSPLSVALGGTGATDAGAARGNLGLGTMSVQNANAVSISGGTATLSTLSSGDTALGRTGIAYAIHPSYWLRSGSAFIDSVETSALTVGGGTTLNHTLLVQNSSQFNYVIGLGGAPDANYWLRNYGNSYQAGSASFAWIVGVAGAADSRWNFINWGTTYFNGTTQFSGTVGMGYEPPSGINLRASSVQLDYLGLAGGIDTTFCLRTHAQIYSGGNNYAAYPGPWIAYSDQRLKTNIQPIPHPLETLCALHGVLYEWIDPAEHANLTGLRMGVLAQEVEAVLPQWVGELSGYKTTQLSAFEALCIESIKALVGRVAALEGASHGDEYA